MSAIAVRMFDADLLKLRKKRGTLIWALVLALVPLLIFFIVRAAQHSSGPATHPPAGGINGYIDGLRIIALFFGPLAAILIGVEGGAGDVAAGVFRDLVVTGRSRTALFASRVPAAVGLTWLVIGFAYALLVIGVFVFASGTPTPSAATLVNGLVFSLMCSGVICAIAVGFAALTSSRPAALTALIGWQLVASPILSGISSLGSSRKLVLSDALAHFSPVHVAGRADTVTMGQGTAIVVVIAWVLVFVALGAWRTRTMDA